MCKSDDHFPPTRSEANWPLMTQATKLPSLCLNEFDVNERRLNRTTSRLLKDGG